MLTNCPMCGNSVAVAEVTVPESTSGYDIRDIARAIRQARSGMVHVQRTLDYYKIDWRGQQNCQEDTTP